MPDVKIVIGNKNTSSWSLRAWLVLAVTGLPFDEIRIPLRQRDTRSRILELSPSGKVPALIVEGQTIWDSLAIAEFLGEVQPSLWPGDERHRAIARSISAEMHSGFADLRFFMPMDFLARFGPPGRMLSGVAADVERISQIWTDCLNLEIPGGPYLFGEFSIADAMFAPVVSRFVTYAVPVDEKLRPYMDAIMAMPEMQAWGKGAQAELDAAPKSRAAGEATPTAAPVRSRQRPPIAERPPAAAKPPLTAQPASPPTVPAPTQATPPAPPPMSDKQHATERPPEPAPARPAPEPVESRPTASAATPAPASTPTEPRARPLRDRADAQLRSPEFASRTVGTFRAQVDLDTPARRTLFNRRRWSQQETEAGDAPPRDADTFFFGIDDDAATQPAEPHKAVVTAAPAAAKATAAATREGEDHGEDTGGRRLFRRKVSVDDMDRAAGREHGAREEESAPVSSEPPEAIFEEDLELPPISHQPRPKTSESAFPDASAADEDFGLPTPRRPAIKPIGGEIHRRR